MVKKFNSDQRKNNNSLSNVFRYLFQAMVPDRIIRAVDSGFLTSRLCFSYYLMFGQSNMEGQGTIEAQDRVTNPRVKMLQDSTCPNLNRVYGKWYCIPAT